MQRNTTNRGNVQLDQKVHEKNWSKNAAHVLKAAKVNLLSESNLQESKLLRGEYNNFQFS